MLKIKVNVIDVDDNPPEFIQRIFTGGIATDTEYGSVILVAEADDPDTDTILEYSVIGKKHALNKYDQFALYTSCFFKEEISDQMLQFHEIFVTKNE